MLPWKKLTYARIYAGLKIRNMPPLDTCDKQRQIASKIREKINLLDARITLGVDSVDACSKGCAKGLVSSRR